MRKSHLTYYVLEILIAFFGTLLFLALMNIGNSLNKVQHNIKQTHTHLEPISQLSDEALKRMRLDVKA